MAVPDAHGPLRPLRGYTSQVDDGTPQECHRAARQALERYVGGVSPGPSRPRMVSLNHSSPYGAKATIVPVVRHLLKGKTPCGFCASRFLLLSR